MTRAALALALLLAGCALDTQTGTRSAEHWVPASRDRSYDWADCSLVWAEDGYRECLRAKGYTYVGPRFPR